jgi:hypothetical protein
MHDATSKIVVLGCKEVITLPQHPIGFLEVKLQDVRRILC